MAQGTQGLEAPGVAERGSPTGFAPGPARKVEGQKTGGGCRGTPEFARARYYSPLLVFRGVNLTKPYEMWYTSWVGNHDFE